MSQLAALQTINLEIQVLLGNKDFKNSRLRSLLKQAKLAIYGNENFQAESEDYLKQATKFSELNLLFTLASRSSKDYENAINNVKFFYENVLVSQHTPQNYSMITAIHLLFLLSTNRNQEFYSKLESITSESLRDQYISYVLLLNDAIEEGNYRKIFLLRDRNPLPEYFGPFLDTISETIRTEIAKSAEKAYSEISLKQALNIFQFQSLEQLRAFSESYHESQEDRSVTWVFQQHKIQFQKEANKRVSFNSEEMILRTLDYSLQLERIA